MLRCKSNLFFCLFLVLICTVPTAAQKQPDTPAGTLLEINFDRTYAPVEIDRAAAELFESLEKESSRYSVDVYIINFASRYLDGTEAPITAQVFVPRFRRRTERPAYIFAAGSTGLIDACRPSREHIIGVNWGLYRTHVLAHAGQGIIGMLPDYTGLGDPERLQPYYVARAEAMMMLDAARALRNFFDEQDYPVYPHRGVFYAGYSQGGNAIFAAADYRETYAADVEIGGIIGYGPARGVEELFREWTVADPLAVYTYSRIYGKDRFDPARILQDKWLSSLEADVTRLCIGGIQSYYPWDAESLYRPAFTRALFNGTLSREYPSIARIMRKNSSGLSGHGFPVIILQGTEDVVVHPRTQADFVNRLRERGSDVLYLVYDGSRHDTRQISFNRVVSWMQEQIAE